MSDIAETTNDWSRHDLSTFETDAAFRASNRLLELSIAIGCGILPVNITGLKPSHLAILAEDDAVRMAWGNDALAFGRRIGWVVDEPLPA